MIRLLRFVLAAALGTFCLDVAQAQPAAGPPPAPSVTVAKPLAKEINEWDDFIGRFDAVDTVDIRARVSGYLDRVYFRDGAIVQVGDRLFTIDPRPYQNAVLQAEASLSSAKFRQDFAQSDFERAEQLRRTGNIPEQVLDQRRQNFLTAKADVDRAEAALRQARLDLDYTEIRSPIAGRISRRLVSQGNLVNANETLLTNIVSLDPIQFYFDVDERSYLAYSRMQTGGTRPGSAGATNEVRVALTGEREATRTGSIDFVDNRLDTASGTMRARAIFENKDLLLTPGLFGRVTLTGSERYRGLLLPDEAVTSDQDRRVVYVVGADNTVAIKPVRPGPRIDGYRVIREGLTGDETVVVNGLMRVRPGAKVAPQMTTLPPTRERSGS